LFADPDIIRLPTLLQPLQSFIAYIISKRRAPVSKQAYASIGGGSPILRYSQQQARLVQESLKTQHGIEAQTYIGMRYWHPFTQTALADIRRDEIDCLVVLPLYPQFSISTSGSSLRVLQQELARQPILHTVVPSWYQRTGYLDSMCALIQAEIDAFTPAEIDAAVTTTTTTEQPIHILFSAHGVPQSYIAAGDPYQAQMQDCVDLLSQRLLATNDNIALHLSYQSRVGPIEWLRPYTDDVLPELGQAGVINLVVVPISFVSEHIETLEEIDMEYKELALESGIKNWKRCPALNTDARFVQDLADLVVQALHEPVTTVTEACVANAVTDNLVDEPDEVLKMAGSSSSNTAERWNARVAMLGVLLTIVVEATSGQSIWQLLSGNG